MSTCKLLPILVLFFLFTSVSPLSAEWIPDGNPVCTEVEWQVYQEIEPDGDGGMYICWEDHRVPASDVYIQRVSSSGEIYWNINGIPICTAEGAQMRPYLVSDGSGGVIVSWYDGRSGEFDIYAQRIDGDGNMLWAENGVPVCTASGDQLRPYLETDGAGGAIIAWNDGRDTMNCIYGQRFDPNGNALWAADGVAILDALFHETIDIVSDGDGGAIIAAFCSDDGIESDIVAQRIDPSGNLVWRKWGLNICSAPGNQNDVYCAADGSGGAVISWIDERNGKKDIYAQRVNFRGRRLWGKDGLAVCLTDHDKYWPGIATDETGGVYITWYESRDDYRSDIFIQHVTANGRIEWAEEGIIVCDAEYTQKTQRIIPDTFGGAIVVWRDFRSSYMSDCYIQRVNSSGEMLWDANGIPVCTAVGTQSLSRMIPDGDGGAFVCWYDTRTDGQFDIYATWINPAAQAALPVESEASPSRSPDSSPRLPLTLYQNHPNPFNPSTIIKYHLPRTSRVRLEIFDVSGSRMACLVDDVQDGGTYSIAWNGVNDYGRPVSSGLYFYRLSTEIEVISKKMIHLR